MSRGGRPVQSRAREPEKRDRFGVLLKDHRFTTRSTRRWCLEQFGLKRYTLDVAACRESHLAPEWFGPDHPEQSNRDGLARTWWGDVWCNEPFSDWVTWLEYSWLQFLTAPALRSVSFLMPNDKTEQPTWQTLVEPYANRPGSPLFCRFLPRRTKFSAPGLRGRVISNAEKNGGSPFFGCVLLYWSHDKNQLSKLWRTAPGFRLPDVTSLPCLGSRLPAVHPEARKAAA